MCRALLTCLNFERATGDQVDSVGPSDESSTFETTAITQGVGRVTGSFHVQAKICSDDSGAGHGRRPARELHFGF
jgi:hypothetical protein